MGCIKDLSKIKRHYELQQENGNLPPLLVFVHKILQGSIHQHLCLQFMLQCFRSACYVGVAALQGHPHKHTTMAQGGYLLTWMVV